MIVKLVPNFWLDFQSLSFTLPLEIWETFLLLRGWSLIFGWLLGPVWPNLSFRVPHRIIVFTLSHILFAAGLEDRILGFWPSWSSLLVPTFLTCKPRVCWASYKATWRNQMSLRFMPSSRQGRNDCGCQGISQAQRLLAGLPQHSSEPCHPPATTHSRTSSTNTGMKCNYAVCF